MRADELPSELIQKILEYGARQSKQFCATLCLVSSWTHDLAYPILYRTIILQDSSDLVDLHRRLQDPHQQRFAPFVHNLCIPCNLLVVHFDVEVRIRPMSLILPFPNLQHLAITYFDWLGLLRDSFYAVLVPGPHEHEPEHLKDMRISLLPDDETSQLVIFESFHPDIHPLWATVTHIHLDQPIPSALTDKAFPFRRLTHLAIPLLAENVEAPVSIEKFFDNPSLQMILIIFVDDKLDAARKKSGLEWFWNRRRNDRRMYLLETTSSSPCDVLTKWADEVEVGGSDIWTKGEKFTHDCISTQPAA